MFRSIHVESWPVFDEKYLEEESVVIVAQVNGKMRDIVRMMRSEAGDKSKVEELARKSEKVKSYLEGKRVGKVIYVSGKVINFVVYG